MEADLALLKRLDEYSLDDPNSSFPFSAKLAKETGWSPSFVKRAIAEYKRFCYLAMTAGHPVSPSDAVDEVWHMHLIYSHEYWNVFCPKVLGRPFHHYPSTGGKSEREKFDDWFAKTLSSYEAAFGEMPPKDIWFPEKPVHAFDEFVTIPKSTIRTVLQGAGLLAAVGVVVGCAAVNAPLDFRGPEFLQFYVLLFLVMYSAAWAVKSLTRIPATVNLDPANYPTPYGVAYMNGKSILAVNTALTNMIRQGVIEFDPKTAVVRALDPNFVSGDLIEARIFKIAAVTGGAKVSALRVACIPPLAKLHQDLQAKGLLVAGPVAAISTLSAFLVALMAPLYGIVKINVGISRDRPVEYLTVLCVISFILCLFLLKPPFRSRYGDKFLKGLKESKHHLQTVGRHPDAMAYDFALGFALFGAGAMAGSIYEEQVRRMSPAPGSSSCSGSSCSSSGGGDGGGSSCGGGGGCGGCGS